MNWTTKVSLWEDVEQELKEEMSCVDLARKSILGTEKHVQSEPGLSSEQ